MRAQILSIGSELMLGHLTDTNATYLAQELASLGVELIGVSQIGDDQARISGAIRSALQQAELVICSGGIGPTEDDLTREAIADVVSERPVVDASLLKTIETFFAGRGLVMPERNAKQAWLIDSAESLPNPVGTAPGWVVAVDDRRVVAMPGVPREMRRMWREEAVPRLRPLLGDRVVTSVTLKTIGIGESAAEDLIHDLVLETNPVVATYAKDDGVHVRVTATGDSAEEALSRLESALTDVRQRLGTYIYAEADQTLAASLLHRLATRGMSLSIVDEGGGGHFATLILSELGASQCMALTTALPAVVGGEPGRAKQIAGKATTEKPGGLSLAIVVRVEPGAEMLVDAQVEVAIGGELDASQTFPLRATFQEVQRRSALHAADVLHRALSQR